MAALESLIATLDAQPNVEACVQALVDDLAERIKATSNDQNIQKLARELREAAPGLVRTIASKDPVA